MKMGTLPTVFPRSAYSLTSLRDLLDKVTWKEVGSARRFIVCFNEHKENEHDEDATQTPVATPQKAKHQSAGPSSRRKSPTKKKLRREFKPSAIDVMIKKEKVTLPSSSSKGEGKAVDVSDEEEGGEALPEDYDIYEDLGLSLPPVRTPSRKRGVSQVDDPQSSRTSPTHASQASHVSERDAEENEDDEGSADLTTVKRTLPRYPARNSRRPTSRALV